MANNEYACGSYIEKSIYLIVALSNERSSLVFQIGGHYLLLCNDIYGSAGKGQEFTQGQKEQKYLPTIELSYLLESAP